MHGYAARFVTLCAMLTAAAAATYLRPHQRRVAESVVPRWDGLPLQVSGWQGESVPVDRAIAEYLQADAMTARVYRKGDVTIAFSAVFGTQWRSLHSPAGCYPSQGWHTVRQQQITIDAPAGNPHPGPLHAEQLLVERSGAFRLVTYLYAYPGGTTSSWVQQCLQVARAGMAQGGIVIILESPCSLDSTRRVDAAQRELLRALYPDVVKVWYGEQGHR